MSKFHKCVALDLFYSQLEISLHFCSPILDQSYLHLAKTNSDIIIHLVNKDLFLCLLFLIISLIRFFKTTYFNIDNLHERINCRSVLLQVEFA